MTGASSGIGRATARALASRGFHVLVSCRRASDARAVAAEIVALVGDDARATAMPGMDLAELKEINATAEACASEKLNLNLRVVACCAGVMACEHRVVGRGKDARETDAAVNAIGTSRLISAILHSRSEKRYHHREHLRVVCVGSFTHRAVTREEFVEWLDRTNATSSSTATTSTTRPPTAFTPAGAYACSKLAATMRAFVTHASWSPSACSVSVVVADPGLVDTRINREWPPSLRRFYVFVARLLGLLSSPSQGADAVLHACFVPPSALGDVAGYVYGANGARVRPSTLATDDAKLRDRVCAMTFAPPPSGGYAAW